MLFTSFLQVFGPSKNLQQGLLQFISAHEQIPQMSLELSLVFPFEVLEVRTLRTSSSQPRPASEGITGIQETAPRWSETSHSKQHSCQHSGRSWHPFRLEPQPSMVILGEELLWLLFHDFGKSPSSIWKKSDTEFHTYISDKLSNKNSRGRSSTDLSMEFPN